MSVDERRKRLLGARAEDADARGEHRYPEDRDARTDAAKAADAAKAEGDQALTREPDQYVAGADGTQSVTPGETES